MRCRANLVAVAALIGTAAIAPPGDTLAQGNDAELSARDIMARATVAAGGDAWRYATTIRLTGNAWLYRAGQATRADDYRMYRVYPQRLDSAHTTTGKFRLDAAAAGTGLFKMSFDGRRMYDQDGPMDAGAAERLAASAFGFSAARFALAEGFGLERLADDQVEGHACHFVRVTDPAGGTTLFAVDASGYQIRLVAWDTPQGWHQRLYSDFYWVEDPGFLQPGRVRLYYDGVKTVDINWTSAEVNVPMPDELFVLGAPGAIKPD
jgi:hypothetical protein